MNIDNIQIPTLNDDQNVEIVKEDGSLLSIKNLINIIIEFINKLIKFEF